MTALGTRIVLLAIVGGLGGFSLSHADEAADDSKTPYANELRQLKDRMGWRKESLNSMVNDFQQYGDFTKADLQLVTAEYQGLVESCQKAIDAYRKGELEAGRALARKSDRAKESRDWRKRFDARRLQAQNWRDENWAEEMQTKWGAARTKAFAPEWVQSTRRASAAWGRYAESIAPGVEREKQIALEDAAYLAEAGVRATEERWRIRQTLDDRLWDKKVTSEELETKIREFEKLGDKVSEIMKQRAEGDRQLRDWQRERNKAERDLEEAFRTAREQELRKAREK